MKKQILVIHGGMTFKTHGDFLSFLMNCPVDFSWFRGGNDWKDKLQENLGEDYDVLQPTMPNKLNAQYDEWVIWFERIAPLLENEVILVGHSLGAVFLAKYLSQNDFPKKISATLLVSAPYGEDETSDETLGDFAITDSLEKLAKQGGAIHLFHSKDDKVVTYSHALQYKSDLPNATLHTFEDRGHFNMENFDELVDVIK